MIQVHSFVFNPFSENTYILFDETKECVIIDPGCFDPKEEAEVVNFIEVNKLKPIYILNTHGHIDHVLGNAYLKKTLNIPLWIPEPEANTYEAVPTYAASYGFGEYMHTAADYLLKENEIIKFGHSSLTTIFAPGHSAGHVAFVNEEENICIGGDILFKGSIGRTDLPGGDFDTLINSIKTKLFTLDDETKVFPGHGDATNIKYEKETNPFLQ